MNPEWLIAGLGNPGKQYADTRHNIGWMVASAIIAKYKTKIKSSLIYHYSLLSIGSSSVLVSLPTTFMNNSGEAIGKLMKKYKIPFDKICIIVDEYNFPLGKIHLKDNGSDGGHNGVESVINYLDSIEFLRLRCGIGKNFPMGGMVDYVLSNFNESEIEQRDIMISNSVTAIEYLVKYGKIRAMTDINSERLWKSENI